MYELYQESSTKRLKKRNSTQPFLMLEASNTLSLFRCLDEPTVDAEVLVEVYNS
jgi:hypothetical protein